MAARVPWWLRAYLLLAGAQTLISGVVGLFSPARTPLWLQLVFDVTRFNARFLGACFLALAVSIVLGALMRDPANIRVSLAGFGIAAGLLLIVTVLQRAEYPAQRLVYPWGGSFLLHAILGFLTWLWLLRHAGPLPRPRQSPSLFFLTGLLLGTVGLLLLLLPNLAVRIWPWRIEAALAQFYGCFSIALATSAALAAREPRSAAGRTFSITMLCLALFVLGASMQHFGSFGRGPSAFVWFGLWGLAIIAFVLDLLRHGARQRSAAFYTVPSDAEGAGR